MSYNFGREGNVTGRRRHELDLSDGMVILSDLEIMNQHLSYLGF